MKNRALIWNLVAMISCILIFSCDDANDDDGGQCWDENWLIGTWEGNTPSTIEPYSNTKIRIVFTEVNLERIDTIPGNTSTVWSYNGTFTWDVDSATWSMQFRHTNHPQPDYNVIGFNCTTLNTATMNLVSLRVRDTLASAEPSHVINLDYELISYDGKVPEYIDFYGDVEIYYNGNQLEAQYPPQEGSMIRMTKK